MRSSTSLWGEDFIMDRIGDARIFGVAKTE